MEYKKSMIIIILAIFLLSIASVCASDANDTAIASEDTTAIELSQNEEITTTDESQKTIQTNDTEILTANDEETTATQNNLDTLSLEEKTYTDLSNTVGTGGDINLQPAYYKYNGESNTITITNPGIINGNGAIIDMAGSTIRAFNVNTAGVTIKNLTIKNTKYNGDGGAIYFAQSGSVINCNFNDNKATGSTSYGGAVYFKSTGNVSNCNFTGNTAADGGAIWMNSGTVSNCNFINNSATGEDSLGGAIVMYSGSVSNCNFTNNHASYAGAVYFYQGTGSVTNCNFTNNTATYQGGAIRFSDTGNVTNCNFTGNTASGDGGAIWMYSGSVENCNFTNNTATYQGGAIFSWNWYTAADTCIFKRNSGENVNVVIYPPTLNVDNFTTFYGSGEKLTFNLTTDSGVPVNNGNISISVYFKDNNSWVRNYSCLSGEGWSVDLSVGSYYAIYNTEYAEFKAINRTITITPPNYTFWALNHTINDNDASEINLTNDYYYDPAYDEAFANGIVINRKVIINGNSHTIDAKGKARVFNVQANDVTIENLTIKNANYNGNGGAVYFAKSGRAINCNFINNTAKWAGAICFNYGSTGTVENCTFINNKVDDVYSDGGAIWMYSGTVSNCNFTNNIATGDFGYGGAVFFLGTGTVKNCNFTDNTASSDGGAIDFEGAGNVTNCNFTNNKATGAFWGGGAVYFNKNVEGNVTNCSFTNNSATKNGGAIYFDEGSTGRTINCNFTDNTANYEGGAIRFSGSGTVTNCNFTNNSASSRGGAVYFYQGTGSVTNCNFTNNKATGTGNYDGGGAVYLQGTGSLTNCNFVDNTASRDGGAIRFSGSGNVSNCNFTDNTATRDGGAVYFSSNGEGNVSNCNFTDNSARDGGAISMDFGTVSNCNFTVNTATRGGGAVYFNGKGDVTNCNFTGNNATGDGGAINMGSGSVSNCNFTGNNATGDGGAIWMYSGTVSNCNFTKNSASSKGGAVYFYKGTGSVTNCNFTKNSASSKGGAVYFWDPGTVTNCNFTVNTASGDGGAVYFNGKGEVTNCNFTGNNATTGSAIYFYKWDSSDTLTVSNSTFLNNRANAEALEITKNDNNITITFTGRNNLLNAIYSREDAEVAFTNVKYWGATGITTVSATMSRSNKAAGQNITVGVVVNNELVLSDVMVTNESGMIVLDISVGENYYISARHDTDSYYTEAERTISNNTKFNVNVTSQTTNNKTVNITAKSNIYSEVMPGKLLFIVPNSNPINATYGGNGTWWAVYTFDDASDYNVNASYIGLDNVTINNATIAIRYDARVDVNNKTLDLLIEDTFTIVATTTPEGLNVSYVPDDSGVYSIDENGVVTALRDGKGSILIKVEGNAGFAVNSTIVNVTVSKIPTEINVLNDTLVLAVCDEIDTGATLTPGDAGNVTYSISNSSVVKVEDGNIIALAEGKANITVSFEGNKKYLEAKNKTISVTVKLKDAKVTADDLTLDVYANATISPVTSPEGLEVEYASGNISIAEVDVNGVVTGYNAGNTTITITTKADGVHAVNSTTINVSVNTINSTIDVNDTVLNYGETTKVNVTTDGALGITAKFDGEEIIFSGYSVPIPVLNAGNYNLTVTTIPDDNHKSTTKTVTITVLKQNTTADISIPANMAFGENSTVNVKLPNDASGNVTLKVDGAIVETVEVSDGSASLNISELSAGNHTVEVSYSGDDNHNPVAKTATITVYKKPTNITAAGVTTTYNINKNLVIALTDCDGNPLSDVNVTVELNTDKIYTTDENGKIVINVGSLTPNTYAATITFKGNENYTESNTTANVVVKKATPKMTVKAKTFKDTTKTKKYTITLKDNKGTPIKNTKVYLKVNGVTYTQTTNSKGQATFKITKLAKKGKYIATITYKGNKNYNKITKKAKITVKQTWKTISKGSKEKAIIKKIQKALKKNGYYIKYNNHYLKIDGIFHKYTEIAVKQFQKAKKLKATGKVDYKTAKKLKII